MNPVRTIPMFPLSILPLPGELVPLHIFEPRYKQLLQDAEHADLSFGIYFNHTLNLEKIGSLMKLESIIKRYPGGESDIIVKCVDIFYLDKLFRNFKSKMYPGGEVRFWKINENELAGSRLTALFQDYLTKRNITRHQASFSVFSMAHELSFDLAERYAFIMEDNSGRERMLTSKVKFQMQLLEREERSKDSYHLN
jgi:uncharacterized protein